ncbi:MAG: copper ion binding protein [Clostridiales Family XIII bacterium]|jgi:copper chaperone|nr:copper ion binding protein [Clostridiales Family XIII bacterium]
MDNTILHVDGMSCEHCVKAVTDAASALDGVHGVDVDLAAGTVTVAHDAAKAPLDKIKLAIEDQGYEVVA